MARPAKIERVASMLRDTLLLQPIGAGHCTSEPGFAAGWRSSPRMPAMVKRD
jgi:hypothetical protein